MAQKGPFWAKNGHFWPKIMVLGTPQKDGQYSVKNHDFWPKMGFKTTQKHELRGISRVPPQNRPKPPKNHQKPSTQTDFGRFWPKCKKMLLYQRPNIPPEFLFWVQNQVKSAYLKVKSVQAPPRQVRALCLIWKNAHFWDLFFILWGTWAAFQHIVHMQEFDVLRQKRTIFHFFC